MDEAKKRIEVFKLPLRPSCECASGVHNILQPHPVFRGSHPAEEVERRRLSTYEPRQSPYFQISSQTVFSTDLLDHVTQQLVQASLTFESQADVYSATSVTDAQHLATNEQHFSRLRTLHSSSSWKLNEKRLEDGWFLLQRCRRRRPWNSWTRELLSSYQPVWRRQLEQWAHQRVLVKVLLTEWVW